MNKKFFAKEISVATEEQTMTIVWADEPNGDLDSKNAEEIINLMVGLNESQNQTFVIVTHAREIAAKTDRIIQMVDGLIVDQQLTERGRR